MPLEDPLHGAFWWTWCQLYKWCLIPGLVIWAALITLHRWVPLKKALFWAGAVCCTSFGAVAHVLYTPLYVLPLPWNKHYIWSRPCLCFGTCPTNGDALLLSVMISSPTCTPKGGMLKTDDHEKFLSSSGCILKALVLHSPVDWIIWLQEISVDE